MGNVSRDCSPLGAASPGALPLHDPSLLTRLPGSQGTAEARAQRQGQGRRGQVAAQGGMYTARIPFTPSFLGDQVTLTPALLRDRMPPPATLSAPSAALLSSRPPRRLSTSARHVHVSMREPETLIRGNRLLEHAQNKHNKGIADCFPSAAAA